MHGGISPHFTTLEEINRVDRFIEVPPKGLLCDLLWSDPVSNELAMDRLFTKNKLRACSVKYGYEPLKRILKQTKTNMLIRGHQVQQAGFVFHEWNKEEEDTPVMCTVFSAPNYCKVYNNRGALISLNTNSFNIQGYDEHASPYRLPNDISLFELSMEQMASTVLKIYTACLKQVGDFDNMDDTSDDDEEEKKLVKEASLKFEQQRSKRMSELEKDIEAIKLEN